MELTDFSIGSKDNAPFNLTAFFSFVLIRMAFKCFPANLPIFYEQLFWRTSANDCFWAFKDHIRDGPMEDIFSLSFSAAIDFYIWVQLGIDVHTHHQKYHVRPHSLWFSCACAAGIAQRNYLFLLSKQNCSSVSKIKFKQTTDCYQRCC